MTVELEKGIAVLHAALIKATDYLVNYGFEVIGAIIILIAGMIASRWAGNALSRFLERRHFDSILSRFMVGGVRGLILGFTLIVALGKFGITIAPIIAALGAIAFGSTLALQGPLSNFAGGLSLLLSRPFTVGDTIDVAGVSGVVEEVKLGATVLSNLDGERITVPNRHIVGEIVKNSYQNHVVEGTVGISYGNDPERAVATIRAIFDRTPEIAKSPPPMVGIREFGDSAIVLGLRYWVPTKQFFRLTYATNLAIWRDLKAAGISIPFPQRDVHMIDPGTGTHRVS